MSYTHAHIEGSSSHVRQRTDQRISREHSRVSTRYRAGIMESSLLSNPFLFFLFFRFVLFLPLSLSIFSFPFVFFFVSLGVLRVAISAAELA